MNPQLFANTELSLDTLKSSVSSNQFQMVQSTRGLALSRGVREKTGTQRREVKRALCSRTASLAFLFRSAKDKGRCLVMKPGSQVWTAFTLCPQHARGQSGVGDRERGNRFWPMGCGLGEWNTEVRLAHSRFLEPGCCSPTLYTESRRTAPHTEPFSPLHS